MEEFEYQTCTSCSASLPLAEFHRNGRGGYIRKCRTCRAATRKAWRETYRDKQVQYRRSFNLSTYGLTEEEYGVMLDAQGGGCAMCGKACRSGRRLAVDHDHQSGRVRGLLCGVCNQSLGVYETIKEAAIKYLAEYGEGNPHISHGAALAMQRSRPRRGSSVGSARLTDDMVREIRARYETGVVTQRDLASEYGVSQNAIGLVLRRETWTHLDDGCSITASSPSRSIHKLVERVRRLTDDQITEARRLHAAGASYRSIAGELGVHHTTIMRLLTGKHWKTN